jgi:hypothetical protein
VGRKTKMQSMPPTKRIRLTDWLPLTLVDIEALLGIVINIRLHPVSNIAVINIHLHPVSNITDNLSKAWVKNCLSFLMCPKE